MEKRDRILKDSIGVKYKLFQLVMDGTLTSYQRFVINDNLILYRIGTREEHARIVKKRTVSPTTSPILSSNKPL